MSADKDLGDCPLPEVAEFLGTFIKPRDEVAAIRRELQSYLHSQLDSDGVPLSAINLPLPASSILDAPPSGLSGARKAYWKALQAHAAAQAKYDALRADLERIKYSRPAAALREIQTAVSVNEDYLPLLRQREKLRKLNTIEKAYSKINSASNDISTIALEDALRKQVGELPSAPSAQPALVGNPEVDLKVLELKKAILSTKRTVSERRKEAVAHEVNGESAVSPHAEVAGLQQALQILTGWMENQLTTIANAEVELQCKGNLTPNGTNGKADLSFDENIKSLYEQYVEARQHLVQKANNPPQLQSDKFNDGMTENSSGLNEVKIPAKSMAEVVLPHIPTLLAIKQEEEALVRHNAYIRRQLSSVETRTEHLMRRLAGESHLVQPVASLGKDWAEAANEAATDTESFVEGRLKVAELSVNSANQALESIQNLQSSLKPSYERQ